MNYKVGRINQNLSDELEIPKPDNKGVRILGVPCVRDRVVQTAIKMVLEPELDPSFSYYSFGFRPGKSQQQAVESARQQVAQGKEFVVDIDLSKFFDRINHDRLIAKLSHVIDDKRILRLIGMTLRSENEGILLFRLKLVQLKVVLLAHY